MKFGPQMHVKKAQFDQLGIACDLYESERFKMGLRREEIKKASCIF